MVFNDNFLASKPVKYQLYTKVVNSKEEAAYIELKIINIINGWLGGLKHENGSLAGNQY